jgi:hypothetical protein
MVFRVGPKTLGGKTIGGKNDITLPTSSGSSKHPMGSSSQAAVKVVIKPHTSIVEFYHKRWASKADIFPTKGSKKVFAQRLYICTNTPFLRLFHDIRLPKRTL